MRFSLVLVLTGLLALGACGSDDNGDGNGNGNGNGMMADAGPPPDAPPTGGVSSAYLVETCEAMAQTECGGLLGTDYICLFFSMQDTLGICSHACSAPTDCQQGYDGPGTPACALQSEDMQSYCGIVCQNEDDCPSGMTCTDLGGGSVCTAEQPGGGPGPGPGPR